MVSQSLRSVEMTISILLHTVKQSSHFLQAHALLNLHIIHSSQSFQGQDSEGQPNNNSADTIHAGTGFKIYSPITNARGASMAQGTALDGEKSSDEYLVPDFTAMQLLKVMSRLTQRADAPYLPYFMLCREFGVRAVDGMVKGKVLDLRWTETVTRENQEDPDTLPGGIRLSDLGHEPYTHVRNSATAVDATGSEEEDMVAVSEGELEARRDPYEEVFEVVGPKLVATTPVMRFAMREVVAEYEDDEQSVSEYASLSDVDEY